MIWMFICGWIAGAIAVIMFGRHLSKKQSEGWQSFQLTDEEFHEMMEYVRKKHDERT